MPKIIQQIAPAKLNLSLHIIGQRADDYHLLQSLVVFMQSGDVIKVKAASNDGFLISGYVGDDDDDGFKKNNLVIKARDLLRKLMGRERCPPVMIDLEKNLPIASGIGGGSADAAATLVALVRHWQLVDDGSDIDAIFQLLKDKVQSLGADSLMCLHGVLYHAPLMVTGIGEVLKPLELFMALNILLINPGVAVSTPQIYQNLQNKYNDAFLWDQKKILSYEDVIAALNMLRNDLYPPAQRLYPPLENILQQLRHLGADFAAMSGSGATCFGVFKDENSLYKAYEAAERIYPTYFLMAGKSYSA